MWDYVFGVMPDFKSGIFLPLAFSFWRHSTLLHTECYYPRQEVIVEVGAKHKFKQVEVLEATMLACFVILSGKTVGFIN
jgi:hypothetical protein